MTSKSATYLTSIGLAVGGVLGIAGTFAPSAPVRGLAWGLDGVALVIAGSLLVVRFFRTGHDIAAAGFVVFTFGQCLVVSSAAMDLARAAPSFGSGVGLWAAGLVLISASRAFPLLVRLIGLAAAGLFAATALQIFAGVEITSLSKPLPFFAYPVLVATFVGWIVMLLKGEFPQPKGR